MARAIRKAAKAAVSPAEIIANDAEDLAKTRLGYNIDGTGYVTELEGELIVNVSKMYDELLSK